MIELDSVHLTLNSGAGPVHILRGIDLKISQGETVGLIGPSGSGKSTLMAVIAGLEQPSSGTVSVGGQRISDMSEDELALYRRDMVGIVFQSFHLIPTMTALENVAIPLEFAGHRDAFAVAEAELKAVGLGHRLTHYPGQLSGGEQQRVALARAVGPGPSLLLADEPTGNLDGETGTAIIDLMFDLHAARNTTLILITHDQSLATRCSRILHLKDGQISGDEAQESGAQRVAAASK